MAAESRMTKEDALRYIHPYVDDELGVNEALEVQGWIARDPDCRAEYDRVAALKRALRERLGGVEVRAPELLKRRVRRAFRAEGRRRRRWLAAGATAAAALALMVGAVAAYQRMMMIPSRLIADTLMIYRVESQSPMDMQTADLKKVFLWLNERFQQEVKPVDFMPADLVGVRLCPFGGKKGAFLRFRFGGRNVGLFIGESQGMPYNLPMMPSFRAKGMDIFETRSEGFRLAFWKTGMWFYALVLEDGHERDTLPRLFGVEAVPS